MRLVKNILKSIIRIGVDARLRYLPLSMATADWYADQIKRRPAIFADLNFQVQHRLPAGMQMNLGIVDVIERTLLTTGQWDPIIEQTLRGCLKPGDVMLDVGANIGYFSLLGSQLVGPAGRVVSFEPSIRALSKLTTHLCINRCNNVTVCSQAMGEIAGTEHLNWAPSSNIGGSTIARGIPSQGQSEPIAVRRLDEVCEQMQLVPSFVKLDVEGFELYALRGARETLRLHHPIVVCELTNDFLEDHGQSGAEMLRFMRELGYEAWLIRLDDQHQLTAEHCSGEQVPQAQAEVLFATEPPAFATQPAAISAVENR
jgi:FkbM family methyltransferase